MGYILILISVIFVTVETAFFGFNLFANSNAEKVADFIAISLCLAGVALIVKEKLNRNE